jgi:hypothetical protein
MLSQQEGNLMMGTLILIPAAFYIFTILSTLMALSLYLP